MVCVNIAGDVGNGCSSYSNTLIGYPTVTHVLLRYQDAVVLAVLSGFIMLGVLGFFFGVLLNTIDVTFFCFAMDLDAGTRSRCVCGLRVCKAATTTR